MALKWWLGLPLLVAGPSSPLVCPGCLAPLDVFGDHLVCCRRTNFAHRHFGVQQAIGNLLSEAGQGYALKVSLPEGCADAALRPADILLQSWSRGEGIALELTVCHGWQVAEQSQGMKAVPRWATQTRPREAKFHLPSQCPGNGGGHS